mgnify:CR=1 FL=1
METKEILKERERFKEIIENEVNEEFSLDRNNPEPRAKRNLIIKINYLKERIEHLKKKIIWKIDN